MAQQNIERGTLAAGGIAAILASACCLGPLILVSIGLSGAWIGNLTKLEPYRPFFLLIAIVTMGFAYRHIYRAESECKPGEVCALPETKRAYKAIFWVVTVLIVIALGFPFVVPYFY